MSETTYDSIIRKDYQELEKFLSQKYPLFNNYQSIKKIHKNLYYIILWIEKINKIFNLPANTFLNEINNNVYFIIHGRAIESKKLVASALRTILECQFKYIYYKDHPIEYRRLEKNDHLFGRLEFSEYVKKYPDIFDNNKEFINEVISELGNLYLSVSNIVHSTIVVDFFSLSNIKDIKFSKKDSKEIEKLIKEVVRFNSLIFFLFFKEIIISKKVSKKTYDFLLGCIQKVKRRKIITFLTK
jgi:hypothetical protein